MHAEVPASRIVWRMLALLCIGVVGLVAIVGSGGGSDPKPPSHSGTFLSLRAGGSDGASYYAAIGATGDTFAAFKTRNGFEPVQAPDPSASAAYFNAGDLNLGRDMHCLPNSTGLACYVSNHAQIVNGNVVFSDDPTAALAGLSNSETPFATVAMEYAATAAIGPTNIVVRECDGVPTPPTLPGSCGGETRPVFGEGEIRSPASGLDRDSGIDVQPGDVLNITATGTMDTGFFFGTTNGPNGYANIDDDSKFPLHPSFPFALLGRIGPSAYFLIGQGIATTYTGSAGRLFLRTNDDTPGNGWGHFDVSVTVQRAATARFYVYDGGGVLQTQAALDSEGLKNVPGICLACHGGTYSTATHTVSGASFLPFNLKSFKYSNVPGLSRASQEQSFRRLNAMIRSTRPPGFDAISDFIDGMYRPQTVNTPGAVARDDYVPSGWSGNPNLYNGVIRPYCTGCHLALGPSRDLDFTQLSQVLAKKANGTLQPFICSTRSMPHSEVAFNHFWTDNGGSWPAYVERPDTLGLSGCTTP